MIYFFFVIKMIYYIKLYDKMLHYYCMITVIVIYLCSNIPLPHQSVAVLLDRISTVLCIAINFLNCSCHYASYHILLTTSGS